MILLIDNYDSFTYNLYQIIAQRTEEIKVVRNDKLTIEDIKQLKPSGIILSPGPGRPEQAGLCVDIVKTFYDQFPILGVCLGHQAIAFAFGGNVIQANEIVHGKSSVIFHNRSQLYQNMSLPFEGGRYHSLVVDRHSLPNNLVLEAESSHGIVMGIKHNDHPVFGVQFHPESILSKEGAQVVENFLRICDLC